MDTNYNKLPSEEDDKLVPLQSSAEVEDDVPFVAATIIEFGEEPSDDMIEIITIIDPNE